jgi:hypothetical protein
MSSDDLADLRPSPEDLARHERKARNPRKAPIAFVKLPYAATLKAAGLINDAPLAVLVEVAYRSFRDHSNEVRLGNQALSAVGISRFAKRRALQQLKKAGLVKVTWPKGGKRSPLVTLLEG